MLNLMIALLTLSSPALASGKELPPEQAPLRMLKVRGEITKNVLTNGSYLDPTEKVCEVNAEVPFYGDFEKGKIQKIPNVALCKVMVGGQEMKVQLMANARKVPPQGGLPAQKQLSLILFVIGPGPDFINYSSQVGGAAGDLEARTITAQIYGTSYESLGLPEKLETISADLTLLDDQG